MAKHIVGAVVTVNGVDFSSHVSSVTVDESKDDHEVTGMSATTKEHINGLPDASITLNFWQDYAAGSVDAVLAPIYAADAAVPVTVKPFTGAVAVSNPLRTMQGLLQNYQALAGAKGEPNATEVTFQNAGAAGIVRTTA